MSKVTTTGQTTFTAKVIATGQTTFVKKVIVGTPIRNVIASASNLAGLSDVKITSASQNQILTFDFSQGKFINNDSATLVI